jgi:hypothetical protein
MKVHLAPSSRGWKAETMWHLRRSVPPYISLPLLIKPLRSSWPHLLLITSRYQDAKLGIKFPTPELFGTHESIPMTLSRYLLGAPSHPPDQPPCFSYYCGTSCVSCVLTTLHWASGISCSLSRASWPLVATHPQAIWTSDVQGSLLTLGQLLTRHAGARRWMSLFCVPGTGLSITVLPSNGDQPSSVLLNNLPFFSLSSARFPQSLIPWVLYKISYLYKNFVSD